MPQAALHVSLMRLLLKCFSFVYAKHGHGLACHQLAWLHVLDFCVYSCTAPGICMLPAASYDCSVSHLQLQQGTVCAPAALIGTACADYVVFPWASSLLYVLSGSCACVTTVDLPHHA
jgi:hypothetical protein